MTRKKSKKIHKETKLRTTWPQIRQRKKSKEKFKWFAKLPPSRGFTFTQRNTMTWVSSASLGSLSRAQTKSVINASNSKSTTPIISTTRRGMSRWAFVSLRKLSKTQGLRKPNRKSITQNSSQSSCSVNVRCVSTMCFRLNHWPSSCKKSVSTLSSSSSFITTRESWLHLKMMGQQITAPTFSMAAARWSLWFTHLELSSNTTQSAFTNLISLASRIWRVLWVKNRFLTNLLPRKKFLMVRLETLLNSFWKALSI